MRCIHAKILCSRLLMHGQPQLTRLPQTSYTIYRLVNGAASSTSSAFTAQMDTDGRTGQSYRVYISCEFPRRTPLLFFLLLLPTPLKPSRPSRAGPRRRNHPRFFARGGTHGRELDTTMHRARQADWNDTRCFAPDLVDAGPGLAFPWPNQGGAK